MNYYSSMMNKKENHNMANSDLVKSLVKGLNIIQLIGESDNGMSLAEIADTMDMKRPAAHNLLRTLCACRFAEKSGNNKYQLGEELGKLAMKQGDLAFTEHISDILRLLALEFPGARVHYAEPVASGIASKLMVAPDSPTVVLKPDNMIFTPYISAFAMLHLSIVSKHEVDAFKSSYPFGEFCYMKPEKYEEYVEFARKNKWSRYNDSGGTRVAVPVMKSGRLKGFLGVFFQEKQIDESEIKTVAASLLKYSKLISD